MKDDPETKRMTQMKEDLTLEQLIDLVGEASGWGVANITFRCKVIAEHQYYVGTCVGICGSDKTVSAGGSDHRSALVALLKNIEMHHAEILRWHKQRCVRAREILDALGIYYVKGDL